MYIQVGIFYVAPLDPHQRTFQIPLNAYKAGQDNSVDARSV